MRLTVRGQGTIERRVLTPKGRSVSVLTERHRSCKKHWSAWALAQDIDRGAEVEDLLGLLEAVLEVDPVNVAYLLSETSKWS